jgi:prevent-host-death family protein
MRQVKLAELKAKLSEHIRAVRRGHEIVILDRETPVARLVPYRSDAARVIIRSPAPSAPKLQEVPLPPPANLDIDAVDVLLEERQSHR